MTTQTSRRGVDLCAPVAAMIAAAALAFGAGPAMAQTAAAATTVPAPAARADGDGPALWAVRDEDSVVYLFGTIHMLRPGTAWGSDKVDAALDASDQVWFEVTNPEDQAAIAPLVQQYGLSPDKPLSSWLTPEEQAMLARAVAEIGLSPAQIDPARPWFAAIMLGTGPYIAAGFDTNQSVELNLRDRALAAGKSIHGFETLDQQIGGLARMSDETQMEYLRRFLGRHETAAAELDRTVAGWLAGDVTVLDQFARENGRDIAEEVHQVFLAQRNADWTDQIETLLDGSGVAFVAVGAAHLAGDDSLQEMLTARGHAVTRE